MVRHNKQSAKLRRMVLFFEKFDYLILNQCYIFVPLDWASDLAIILQEWELLHLVLFCPLKSIVK